MRLHHIVAVQGLFFAAQLVVANYPQQLTNPHEQRSSRQPGFLFLFRVSPYLLYRDNSVKFPRVLSGAQPSMTPRQVYTTLPAQEARDKQLVQDKHAQFGGIHVFSMENPKPKRFIPVSRQIG